MNQLTFSDIEYSNRKKKTKREEFLDAMEEIVTIPSIFGIVCMFIGHIFLKMFICRYFYQFRKRLCSICLSFCSNTSQ